jgi:hypothetical protein
VSAVTDAVGVVAGAVQTAIGAVVDGVTAAAGAIADGLQAAWDAVVSFFSDLFGSGQPQTGTGTPGTGGGQPAPSDPAPSTPGQPEPTPEPEPEPAPPPEDGQAGDNPDGPGDGATGGTGKPRGPSSGGRGPGLPGIPTGQGGGFGSGVIDPLETALGRITFDFIGAVGGDPAAFFAEGGPDGGGAPEPGTGGPARTIGGGTIAGARLSQFVPHFDRDPSPLLGQAAQQLRQPG